jgi:hypothetical protein
LVFRDTPARDEFCRQFKLEDNRYQDGRAIQGMLDEARQRLIEADVKSGK